MRKAYGLLPYITTPPRPDLDITFTELSKVVYDGPGALEAARDFQPEVAFLDIGLPGINGYNLARQLRKEPGLKEVLLVALTGYGQEGDRRRALEAGFDEHLTKPTRFDTLQRVLAERAGAVTV